MAANPIINHQDDPGPNTSTPLATIAAPGATAAGGVTGLAGAEPVAPEFALTRLKPLRWLKHWIEVRSRTSHASRRTNVQDDSGAAALGCSIRTA